MSKIRLRLAPSPTGFLHIGNLRTALFGYLLAKSQGGDFILRIEDTDEKREVAGAVQSLTSVLAWANIRFDEGPEQGGPHAPYIQSERLAIYKKYSDQLLEEKKAYLCFCSAERLTQMREEQQANKQAPRYDRACRNLSEAEVEAKLQAGETFVIRQAMPLTGEIKVVDELRGEIIFQAEDLEDHVLIKSSGIPTYQFANVVDDHLMEISHVTRGDEWLPSYPKNFLLYQSFGWEAPKFIHLPLILNRTGGKLSKRQGDVFVEDYRAKGYLPEALVNFCAMLGWHSKTDKEIFTLDELISEFSLAGMGASPAVFDLEKLDFYNGHYIREKDLAELADLCQLYLAESLAHSASSGQASAKALLENKEYLEGVLKVSRERLKKLSDIAEQTKFFFTDNLEINSELLAWKSLTKEQAIINLGELKPIIENIAEADWQSEKLNEIIFGWIKASDKKVGDYLWPLRVALTGEQFSPGPFELMPIFGKAESLKRIGKALK